MLTALAHDLRFALRRLRRAPLFTVFAVVTLALAIGIVTAVYSLVRAGLQMELGLGDTDRLVIVARPTSLTGSPYPIQVSWPDYQDVVSQGTTLEAAGAWTTFTNALVARGTSEFANGEIVSGGYFTTVGLRPLRGRLIDVADDRPGAAPVAVLSASAWRSRFSRDPSAVGSTIKIAGHPFEVIGIAPESFRGLRPRGGFGQPDVWVPLSSAPALASRWSRQNPDRRDQPWLTVVGRLASGRTRADANAEFQLIGGRIDAVAPLPDEPLVAGGSVPRKRAWAAFGVGDRVDLAQARDVFRVVLMLPALVLIVACTNLGNFALSRGLARQHEFGIRLAIGGSRWQLVRSQLVEYVLVAALGGAGALLVASGLMALVAGTLRHMFGDLPQYRIDARLDGAVIAVVGAAALLSLIVAGLIPALQLTRRSLRQSISSDSSAVPLQRWRGRSNLIALQVGVSVALLLVAALCVRQLPKLAQRVQSGMTLDRVALVNVPFVSQSMKEPAVRQTIEALFETLRTLPGSTSMSASSDRRFSDIADVAADGRPIAAPRMKGPTTRELSVTPGYFTTVGLPIIAGRPFDDRDAGGAERVAILNDAQARTLFGTTKVIGHHLSVRDSHSGEATTTLTIVGVAADTHSTRSTLDSIEQMLYMPLAQRFEDIVPIEMQVRAADGVDPAAWARLTRDALRRVNPDIAVAFVGRADAADIGPRVVLEYFVLAFGSLAFLALSFAMSGLYGVLAHVVAGRTREMGVRAALGADPARLVRVVLRDGSRPVLEGIVLGFGLAAGARMGMQPWFTEPVTAVDPVALVIALIPLVLAAAVACYIPARRASRVDPNVALRHL